MKTLYDIARREHYDHIATDILPCSLRNGKYFVRTAADPAKISPITVGLVAGGHLRIALTPMGERIKKR